LQLRVASPPLRDFCLSFYHQLKRFSPRRGDFIFRLRFHFPSILSSPVLSEGFPPHMFRHVYVPSVDIQLRFFFPVLLFPFPSPVRPPMYMRRFLLPHLPTPLRFTLFVGLKIFSGIAPSFLTLSPVRRSAVRSRFLLALASLTMNSLLFSLFERIWLIFDIYVSRKSQSFSLPVSQCFLFCSGNGRTRIQRSNYTTMYPEFLVRHSLFSSFFLEPSLIKNSRSSSLLSRIQLGFFQVASE